jgi:hypothetical protein
VSSTCDICSGAIPDGQKSDVHTAICAEVMRSRAQVYLMALGRIQDLMRSGPTPQVWSSIQKIVDEALK